MTRPTGTAKFGNRYPIAMAELARNMYGDGGVWSTTEIAAYIAERFPAPHPARATIQLWVNDERRTRRNVARQGKQVKRRRTDLEEPGDGVVVTTLARSEVNGTLMRLRRAGLSYVDIAAVVGIYHGLVLSAEHVRHRCRRLGAAPSPRGSAFTPTTEGTA